MTPDQARDTWALDREIVLTRVLDAPREKVWRAWTDPQHVTKWFAPAGFTCRTHEIDVREGGRWRFTFVGPDGTVYENRMVYLRIAPPSLLVVDHGSDVDEDPNRFRVTVTFDEQSDGRTVLTMRQLHPTAAQREAVIGFGAVAIGLTTLASLEAHLAAM